MESQFEVRIKRVYELRKCLKVNETPRQNFISSFQNFHQ